MGSVEQAERGTLLLDEIGRASIPLQSKLLRLLDQRSFCRSGAHNPQPFRGRILATTSLDLVAALAEGTFLPDLYHCLAVVTLALPPLRNRTQDIVPLFQHFARQFAAEYDVPVPSLPPEWVDQMTEYAWPGNIRELRNAVERCMLQHDGKQLVFGEGQQDLQAAPSMMSMAMERRWSAPELQSRYARFVYEQVNHNKAQACRILQINYRTLCNHLRASPNVVDASAVAV
jgi:two-component system C4-dicarboxylate transport response regulator DctD